MKINVGPGAIFTQPVPQDFNAFAYVVGDGSGLFGRMKSLQIENKSYCLQMTAIKYG
jgi:hypothetical protein